MNGNVATDGPVAKIDVYKESPVVHVEGLPTLSATPRYAAHRERGEDAVVDPVDGGCRGDQAQSDVERFHRRQFERGKDHKVALRQ